MRRQRGRRRFRGDITSRTKSSLVNATFAIAGTSIPWADRSTICARRQVTTEPLPADDPHQAVTLVDLTHTQPFSQWLSLIDRHPRRKSRRGKREAAAALATRLVTWLGRLDAKGRAAPRAALGEVTEPKRNQGDQVSGDLVR